MTKILDEKDIEMLEQEAADAGIPAEEIEEVEEEKVIFIDESSVRKKERVNSNVKLFIKDILIACAIAILISLFIRPTVVKETSMEPTVEPNDYLIMSTMAYKFGEVERGDIIIFESDLKYDEVHNKLLIKRVIALPGDTIAITGGQVYLNGELLQEDYIAPGGTPTELEELTVPEGQVFVMGDHREVSVDSRVLGCVDMEDIKGQAVFRIYPFGEFGTLD